MVSQNPEPNSEIPEVPPRVKGAEGTGQNAEPKAHAGTPDSDGDSVPLEPESGVSETRRFRLRQSVLASLLVIAALMATCTVYHLATWPDVEALKTRNPETTAFIERYKERAREAGREPRVIWRWAPFEAISPHLKRAVVVAEDIEFFSHEGFALSEIREAIREALSGERVRGASTITQQLAKNLWLSPSRNPLRKLREALLTQQLERELSKRRILELYLNVVEFGPGIYGAESAARHYFGRPASDLSEWESAQLAAALPRPSQWHPGSGSDRYWWYVSEVQRRMERAEFLWRYFAPEPVLPGEATRRPSPDTALGPDTLAAPVTDSHETVPNTIATPVDTAAAHPDTSAAAPDTSSTPPDTTAAIEDLPRQPRRSSPAKSGNVRTPGQTDGAWPTLEATRRVPS